MNSLKKTTLALGLLLAGAAYAQSTPATTTASAGLLGQRYAEFGLGLHDIKSASENADSIGASANLPVMPGLLDVGATYAHDWKLGAAQANRNNVGAYATAYTTLGGVKPFAGLGLGWQTNRHGAEDQAVWNATTGLEIPAGDLTLTPRVSFADDFEVAGVSVQQLGWAVDGNCWVSPTTGVFASVGHSEIINSPTRSWDYQLGVRVKF